MTRNRHGKGDDFLEGRIANENMEEGHHGHDECHHHHPGNLPITTILCTAATVGGVLPTCPGTPCCQPQVGPGCCWIILATTNCTTTVGGATCCWRLLATTDCTSTVGGAACCWQILATTDCTSLGGDSSDC